MQAAEKLSHQAIVSAGLPNTWTFSGGISKADQQVQVEETVFYSYMEGDSARMHRAWFQNPMCMRLHLPALVHKEEESNLAQWKFPMWGYRVAMCSLAEGAGDATAMCECVSVREREIPPPSLASMFCFYLNWCQIPLLTSTHSQKQHLRIKRAVLTIVHCVLRTTWIQLQDDCLGGGGPNHLHNSDIYLTWTIYIWTVGNSTSWKP